ncbi:hypothetical protein ACIBU0_36030 [Streptomyces sp. NPDC049627]|uniref:hypothetical protein n=1 Tax=Streptomyces sp. NPDC049627 TaxID=3365595 RepID=UPI00379163BE
MPYWPTSPSPCLCPRPPSRVCGARRTSPYGGRMTAPGPGVLSAAHSAHGAAPVAHEPTDWWGLSDIDATCPPMTKTHREAGRNRPTGCNIPLAGHQGDEEVTGTLGHAPDRVRLVDGPADGEVFRGRFLNCRPRPAATSAMPRRTAGLPAARRFEPARATSRRAPDGRPRTARCPFRLGLASERDLSTTHATGERDVTGNSMLDSTSGENVCSLSARPG